ncbi:hypothetical protein L0Y59_02345 [Candidatus Uhrbacteria bacterium]|nr:hypothetical protein [Candidatus Uhrbacteria bacterium]
MAEAMPQRSYGPKTDKSPEDLIEESRRSRLTGGITDTEPLPATGIPVEGSETERIPTTERMEESPPTLRSGMAPADATMSVRGTVPEASGVKSESRPQGYELSVQGTMSAPADVGEAPSQPSVVLPKRDAPGKNAA